MRPSFRPFVLLSALALLPCCCNAAAAAAAAVVYDPIWTYQPISETTSFSILSKDLEAIDEVLRDGSDAGFQKALKIYNLGAYSDPFAILTVSGGIPYALPDGTTLKGQDAAGGPIQVQVVGSFKADEKVIKVAFRQKGKTCLYAGIPEPVTDGCLDAEGHLVWEGKPKEFGYTYTLSKDIQTAHQISNFSILAKSKMRAGGSEYFTDFQKQVNFFGLPNYGDMIVNAAVNEKTFSGKRDDFFLDFETFTPRARRSVMVHTMAFMIVGQFIIRQLDVAIAHCERQCTSKTVCNYNQISALDDAVALYTGSMFQTTGKGNFYFGLADNMCKQFKTCGPNGTLTEGHAQANYIAFDGFQQIQSLLNATDCLGAKKVKEKLVREMQVPLVQASLLAIEMNVEEDTMERRAERVIFTAMAAPLLFPCDMGLSLGVCDALDAIDIAQFVHVKKVFEDHYRCLGVTCQQIGGVWDEEAKAYKRGAQSCYIPPPVEEPNTKKKKAFISTGAIVGGFIFFSVSYYVHRQLKYRRRRLREADGDDDEDDDNISIGGLSDGGSVNSIT